MTIEFIIDYFRITVHLPFRECTKLYDDCFKIALGGLIDLQHGAKGYKGVMGALQGFQLKHSPGNGREYCTFEFPGQACGSVAPEQFQDLFFLLTYRGIRMNVTRIDLAFDNVPFTPRQLMEAIIEDANRKKDENTVIRSLSERDSISWHSKPLKVREDESGLGQDTCYFGERSSMRYLRVYNKRGPTRLELELKEDRANLVAACLLLEPVEKWFGLAISHLRDFIDVQKPWWNEFINENDRAYKKLNYAKDVSLEKSESWLLNQVSPALAAVMEITDGEFIYEMEKEGKKRMDKRYGSLLSAFRQFKS